MAQFDYKGFLKEGGIEKYLLEENFGNDIESRYQFVRPLMSRLPDTAYTESLIDGMEEGRAEDDKTMFDFYFVETMKALGLESELMEAESLINPEAEEIDDDDLGAAADYFDSLAENDDVLDEMLDEGKFQEGDLVVFKGQENETPMKVLRVRKMFGSPLQAVTVVQQVGPGRTGEYDETQLVKLEELEGEVQSEEVSLKPGMVQRGNVMDAIKLLNHIQYEYADAFSEDSMDKVSDVIVMLNQVMKQK